MNRPEGRPTAGRPHAGRHGDASGRARLHPDTTLGDVARLMARERVHCVVVRGDAETDEAPLWRIVSDLDLVAAASVRPLEDQSAGGTAATPS